jgi:hypothetical protein
MKFYSLIMTTLLHGTLISVSAFTTEDRILKPNYQVDYIKSPVEVSTFGNMITQGEVYGRIRSNAFWWDWEKEIYPLTQDNNAWGLGGSIVYKTAFLHGFGATVGFYGTIPLNDENTRGPSIINYAKAGKDTFHTRDDGSEGAIGVVAEGYGEYKTSKNDLKIGRQIIESTLLASNDGKMVPNTFEAAVFETKLIPDTTARIGYVMSQKLRDHQSFHSLIAYKKYNENDDNGVNKGLTPALIQKYGADVNPEMLILTVANKSIPNLLINGEYDALNGFFSTSIAELNYQFPLTLGWQITPGLRYLYQHDRGAGKIGGASLNGVFKDNYTASDTKGYTNPNSVDGSMWAARIVANRGPLTLMIGYSDISDKADLIAPWRGFPTGGYTRSMSQLDWIANTQNTMLKAEYDFNKERIVPGLKIAVDYVTMNFDDAKVIARSTDLSDRNIFHIDLIQEFSFLPNAEFRFRFATISADPSSKTSPTLAHDYESYNDYRLELNYLF